MIQGVCRAYEPVERDLEDIGAKNELYRVVTDPMMVAAKAYDSFTSQPPAKQVEELSSSVIESSAPLGLGKVASEALNAVKAAELISKAQAHLKRIEGALCNFDNAQSFATENGIAFKKYVFEGEKQQLSGQKAAERLGMTPGQLHELTEEDVKALGVERIDEYRKTFFDAHPELQHFKNDIVVHHAIEQDLLVMWPRLFSANEINSIENLRGIPKELDDTLHKSVIRKEWNRFYLQHEASPPTRQQVIEFAQRIDAKLGGKFVPKARTD
jgi:hypothetical protein